MLISLIKEARQSYGLITFSTVVAFETLWQQNEILNTFETVFHR